MSPCCTQKKPGHKGRKLWAQEAPVPLALWEGPAALQPGVSVTRSPLTRKTGSSL